MRVRQMSGRTEGSVWGALGRRNQAMEAFIRVPKIEIEVCHGTAYFYFDFGGSCNAVISSMIQGMIAKLVGGCEE